MSEVNDDEDYGFDEEIKKYEESVQSDNKDDDDDIFDDQQNTVDEHNDDDDFFDEQNAESLAEAVRRFESAGVVYSKNEIKEYSDKFSVDRFKKEIQEYVYETLNKKQ